MSSKSPLLKFKEESDSNNNIDVSNYFFDIKLGYWKNINDDPLVLEMMKNDNDILSGQTLLTATQESIDRSEGSMPQTSITKTRESIDQIESSNGNFEQFDEIVLRDNTSNAL